jgi:hypothetical protein
MDEYLPSQMLMRIKLNSCMTALTAGNSLKVPYSNKMIGVIIINTIPSPKAMFHHIAGSVQTFPAFEE